MIFNLGELGCPFVVHLGLQLAADLAVALTHLPQDISLVLLSGHRVGHGLLGERVVLSVNFGLQVGFFVLDLPLRLPGQLLLQLDVSFPVLINVLQQVYPCLVFTAPLLFLFVPHFGGLDGHKTVNHLLVLGLVSLLSLVELLKGSDFISSGYSLLVLDVSDGPLSLQSDYKHIFVTLEFSLLLGNLERELAFVVHEEVLVALAV